MKGFAVTVLIVCWLAAVPYGELAERSPGAVGVGCWQVRCVSEWVGRLCTAVPRLLGMKALRAVAEGLLSTAAAGVPNRALLQHSAPYLSAAAHRGRGSVQSHGHCLIPVHCLAREPLISAWSTLQGWLCQPLLPRVYPWMFSQHLPLFLWQLFHFNLCSESHPDSDSSP